MKNLTIILGYTLTILGFFSIFGFAGAYYMSASDRWSNIISMLPAGEMVSKKEVEKILLISTVNDSSFSFSIYLLSGISMLLGAVLIDVSGRMKREEKS